MTPKPNSISIRMYCLGTGDCFVIKFYDQAAEPFTVLLDCGTCRPPKEFDAYKDDLSAYIGAALDLLIITHEHNDHVNGFEKWAEIFENLTIREAWFAWTENPKDPTGRTYELMEKRKKMRKALHRAITEIKKRELTLEPALAGNFYKDQLLAARTAFTGGLDSIAEVNLNAASTGGKSLAGMDRIKKILEKKEVKVRYLDPGESVLIPRLPGINFHILGPPADKDNIFKNGKEGKDVFRRNAILNESSLAANAFSRLLTGMIDANDLPFSTEFLAGQALGAAIHDPDIRELVDSYDAADWRRIDDDWLNSAGALAIRLNSHINNTSLVIAVESVASGKVLLFPGDAEYASWRSWHLIKKWEGRGRNGKHLVEDLLNRTVFYKVSHHLSYNGTALDNGIHMMTSEGLVAMATLDRNRIAEKWKSTMPNIYLVNELVRKTQGRLIIMDECEIEPPPSASFSLATLGPDVYETKQHPNGVDTLYKQYAIFL